MVEIEESNQRIIDECDIIFIGLLPHIAKEELKLLKFYNTATPTATTCQQQKQQQSHKLVVSMMATVDMNVLYTLIDNDFPRENIVRTIPLPSCAFHEGPILMYPDIQLFYGIYFTANFHINYKK